MRVRANLQPSPALHHTACTIADSAVSVAVSRRAMSLISHSMTGLGAMAGLGKRPDDDDAGDDDEDTENSMPSFHPGLLAKLDPSRSSKQLAKSAPTADNPEAVRAAIRLQRAWRPVIQGRSLRMVTQPLSARGWVLLSHLRFPPFAPPPGFSFCRSGVLLSGTLEGIT